MSFGVRLRVVAIKLPVWVKRGSMLVRREALDPNDPDHPYNYAERVIGVKPEDFGIWKPHVDRPSDFRQRDENYF